MYVHNTTIPINSMWCVRFPAYENAMFTDLQQDGTSLRIVAIMRFPTGGIPRAVEGYHIVGTPNPDPDHDLNPNPNPNSNLSPLPVPVLVPVPSPSHYPYPNPRLSAGPKGDSNVYR